MDIPSALSGISSALSLARTAVDARDDAKLRAALLDMFERLMAAQTASLALSQEVEHLRSLVRQLEQEKVDRTRYVLQEVSAGRFALRYQPAADDPTPVHHICQACHDGSKKVILRYVRNGLMGTSLDCAVDSGHSVHIRGAPEYRELCGTSITLPD